MSDPVTHVSAAAGGALIKIFGLPVLAGSLAASLGFMIMWPRTKSEAFARFASSIVSSAVVGPLAVIWLQSWKPELFESAKLVAILYGTEAAAGFLFIAAPVMVAAGLPAWWVLGAIIKWFDNRKGQDVIAMLNDASVQIQKAKEAL